MRQNESISVDLAWTDYRDRGLRVPAGLVDGPVGSWIAVFDRNLDFTRHTVVGRDDRRVHLGPAEEWPDQ